MKRILKRLPALVLVGVLALCGLAPECWAAEADKTATILFTHDMHSHLLPAAGEEGGTYGGFARLATALEAARAQANGQGIPCLTVDGGDFSMGTLFQTIYTTQAAELRCLGAMGFDAVTLGNHEFEYRAQGLGQMLNAAVDSGDPLPAIVQANYTTLAEHDGGYAVVQAMERYGVRDYVVIEKQGVRFAVFGLMGEDADDCAPLSGMVYQPMVQEAQRVVDEIQANEDYDFIICLSHGGTDPDPRHSEDERLAQAVDGIDLIVSGHTHSTLEQPKLVNNTVIGCVGEYGARLGQVTLRKAPGGVVSVESYRLIPIDEGVEEDPAMAQAVEQYKSQVEREYLARFQMDFDQVLAHTGFAFTPFSRFAARQEEDGLGNLITDAYRYAVEQAEGGQGAPITAAFVNAGVIRGSFPAGDITVSDAFLVSSLGSGADGTPGYPLLDVYLTGRDLKNALELDPSVGPLFTGAQLYASGVAYSFNMHRPIFNRVTDPALVLSGGDRAPIENDKLYRVVTNLYSSQMLSLVTEKSYGILRITPRDAQGEPISDYEARVLHLPGGGELKEWYALASYLASFPQEDGTPQVPARYAGPEGRKVRVESVSPVALLKQPRWTTVLALGLCLAAVTLVVLVVLRLTARKSRRRYGPGRGGGRGYRRYRG